MRRNPNEDPLARLSRAEEDIRRLKLAVFATAAAGGGGGSGYGAKIRGGLTSAPALTETTIGCATVVDDSHGLSDGTGFTVTEDGLYIMVGSFTLDGTATNAQYSAIVRAGTGGAIYGFADHYNETASTARLACNIVAGAHMLTGDSVILRVYAENFATVMNAGGSAQNQNDFPQFTIAKVG